MNMDGLAYDDQDQSGTMAGNQPEIGGTEENE